MNGKYFTRRVSFRPVPLIIILYGLMGCACGSLEERGANRLSVSALALTGHQVTYDPSYRRLAYPMGDVPADRGVCADVVVRAYRGIGIDLQQRIHEDMTRNFSAYPNRWGMQGPDANIDHRRVPNLMTWFGRQGASLARSRNAEDYLPGDVVAWRLQGGIMHIGMVSHRYQGATGRPLMVHNIGGGQVLEDCLFHWEIIGHYRYH